MQHEIGDSPVPKTNKRFREMKQAFRCALAASIAIVATSAASMQRTETITLGASPVGAWVDADGGPVVAATEGPGRTGGLAMLERGGRITTLPLPGQPVAVAGAAHRAVVALAGGRLAVVDLASLKVRAVAIDADAIVRVVAAERAATVFVLARTGRGTVVTALDVKTLATRATVLDEMQPVDLAYDPGSDRLAVLGATTQKDAAPASTLQLLEGRTLLRAEAPVRLARLPRALANTSGGEEIVILDHAGTGTASMRWRPILWVLDAHGIAQRSVALGEARRAPIQAVLDGDAVPGRVVVGDLAAGRVLLVNTAAGTYGTTQLEAPLAALGSVPGSGALVVPMPAAGTAAILSGTGERLDTIAIGHAGEANADAAYAVVPDAEGTGAIVVHGAEGTLTRLPKQAARIENLTDLWADPAEPGWGVFLEQQGLTTFAALFHYGGGEPTWLVMSNGTRQADGTFSGVLFRTQGPPPLRASDAVPVGIMRIVPAPDGSATLTYVADGQSVTRRIERFGDSRPCRWTTSLEASPVEKANFTSLWSNPADPGWGLAISHHAGSIFAVLFTYDATNRPTWMVMSRGKQLAPGQFAGELYRIGKSQVRDAGSMSLRFDASDEGIVSWRIDGTEFRAPLFKQRFAPLVSKCG